MKVAFVIRPDIETSHGGDVVQFVNTALELEILGVEVQRIPGGTTDYSSFDIVHVFNLQTPPFTYEHVRRAKDQGKPVAVSTIYWAYRVEEILRDWKRWQKMTKLFGHRLAGSLLKVRLIRDLENDRRRIVAITELADLLLPNSDSEGKIMPLPKGYSGLVRSIPNGIDTARFSLDRKLGAPAWMAEHKLDSDGFILICARVEPPKNQLNYIRSVQSLGYPVVLAGATYNDSYAQECRNAGGILLGPLEGDELVASFLHARVHALPSFRETPGLANLEAAACGCAIVSTSIGSGVDYFGEEAHYCHPLSPNEMKTATVEAWRRGRQTALAQRISQCYTWGAAAKYTLDAYRELLLRSSSSQ